MHAGVEFETVWRGLKGRPEEQAAYLRLVEPSELPGLLKKALTGPLLASLMNAAILSAVCSQLSRHPSICSVTGDCQRGCC